MSHHFSVNILVDVDSDIAGAYFDVGVDDWVQVQCLGLHCVFSKDKFYASMLLSFTAESDASINHNHLFLDFKQKSIVKMDSFNLFQVFKGTWFSLWSAVVLDQMSVFGLAECTLGSDHRPSDKTHSCGHYSVLFFELLAANTWCFTNYLWQLMNTCVCFWGYSQTFTRTDKTRHTLVATTMYFSLLLGYQGHHQLSGKSNENKSLR